MSPSPHTYPTNSIATGIFTRYPPAFHPAKCCGCREINIAFDIQPQRRAAADSASGLSAESVVLKKLSPTTAGAKRYAARYGETLVCVRYPEDPHGKRRLTTVELIVDERPLPTPAGVRIAYGETELRHQVKAAGGIWDAERKLWRLPKTAIRKLKLEKRIVSEDA
jgi:hypothetical protein